MDLLAASCAHLPIVLLLMKSSAYFVLVAFLLLNLSQLLNDSGALVFGLTALTGT